MKKKVSIFVIATVSILFLVSIIILVLDRSNKDRVPITTKEAFDLGISYAREKYPSAQVQMLTSLDDPNDHKLDDGKKGKKRFWNLDIAIPNSEKHLLLTIKDGKISNSKEIQSVVNNSELINSDLENNIISSDDKAVNEVIKNYDLNPSKYWAYGYQFVLENRDNVPVLSIVATDRLGYMARIGIDSVNKNVIFAEHKVIDGGGIYKNNDLINIPNYDNNAIVGMSQTIDDLNRENLLVWGWFGEHLENKKPKAFISKEGGGNWGELTIKDTPINMWFSSENFNEIFMTTNKGLYVTKDYGNSWIELINYIENLNVESRYSNGNIVLMNGNKLLISNDNGSTWSEDELSIELNNIMLTNNNIFILSDNKILQKKDNEWTSIFDISEKDIIGSISGKDCIILYSKNNIFIYSVIDSNWKEINLKKEISNMFFSNNETYLYYTDGEVCKLIEGNTSLETILKIDMNIKLKELIFTNNNHYYIKLAGEYWDIMKGEKYNK